MNNYDTFHNVITEFFESKGIHETLKTNLHESSKNDQVSPPVYLYNGSRDLSVISMDAIAQKAYKKAKNAPADIKRTMNTVDAFIINKDNEWFFIEFKDCKLSAKKDNIEKKGMGNWLMLLDMFFDMTAEMSNKLIELSNPCKFAREHITYIVVCSAEKDPYTYEQIRNSDKLGEKYTPPCLDKFKDYLFKNAYAYTEEYFEQRFVKTFLYE